MQSAQRSRLACDLPIDNLGRWYYFAVAVGAAIPGGTLTHG
jgi:hypothetical protein